MARKRYFINVKTKVTKESEQLTYFERKLLEECGFEEVSKEEFKEFCEEN